MLCVGLKYSSLERQLGVLVPSNRVAFQGEHGAYSEQAVLTFFSEAEPIPCRTVRQVFDSVEERSCEFGLVPAENSLEGSVNPTYDSLLESPLKIRGEIKIRIIHCLLALPNTKISDIQEVYSHPQALAQCSIFLKTLDVECIPSYDTAGSAKMIMERQIRNAAAVASERSAHTYGLSILRHNIEDSAENYTRFFIIGWLDASRGEKNKTSIAFQTKHAPGALCNVIGELARRGINLTKIESRPVRTTPWEYSFFVDFEGHSEDKLCTEALDAMKQFTTQLKVLGSYPSAT